MNILLRIRAFLNPPKPLTIHDHASELIFHTDFEKALSDHFGQHDTNTIIAVLSRHYGMTRTMLKDNKDGTFAYFSEDGSVINLTVGDKAQ